jgi:hypothetical protein
VSRPETTEPVGETEDPSGKLELDNVEPRGDANPLIVKTVIEDASWLEDDTVQEMWAGILAVAAGEPAAADDSVIYTDTLKRLTAFQPRFLKHVYGDPRLCTADALISPPSGRSLAPHNPLLFSFAEILCIRATLAGSLLSVRLMRK